MHDHGLSTSLVPVQPDLFTREEEFALAGDLAGYSGLTYEAYALDLRQYVTWCTEHHVVLFGACRADIETFGRHLESLGRARATIARRLCTIAAFYRYAEEEGLIATSPAVHVRRPRLDYESNATGLDRNEVGALLVAAGLANARDHALINLLALNGLRVSEATGADAEALGFERGHRTLTIHRKGGKGASLIDTWGTRRSTGLRDDSVADVLVHAHGPARNRFGGGQRRPATGRRKEVAEFPSGGRKETRAALHEPPTHRRVVIRHA